MTYKPIRLTDVLHEQQMYVDNARKELGVAVAAVLHDASTDTCFEKAKILDWAPERVVKAAFLTYGREVYGFILPELGTDGSPAHIDKKVVMPRLLGVTRKNAKSFHNSYCPKAMEYGTCSPFVLETSFSQEKMLLRGIFVHDMPSLDDQLVDISIGGSGEQAHKTSLHLPYSGIYDILHHTFGDKIKKTKLI